MWTRWSTSASSKTKPKGSITQRWTCPRSFLVVSQFTLYGDVRKGRRPSFSAAAPPQEARVLFERAVDLFRETGLTVKTGRFQERMMVQIQNDGPVTIAIDSADRHRPRRG